MTRRRFLSTLAAGGAALLCPAGAAAAEEGGQAEVSPNEDLMREHGALNRILLIYDDGLRRLRGGGEVDGKALKEAAGIVRRFIEGYHERLEEEFVFPRVAKAGGESAALVEVLERQHKAGRKVTERILELAKSSRREARAQLDGALEAFVRMYRPHEAREDTVVFPAFHASLSEKEYDELGDKFEAREHQLFGKAGFEGVLGEIAELEMKLGLYDLAQFTPS